MPHVMGKIFEAPIPGKIFDPQVAPAQEYPSEARSLKVSSCVLLVQEVLVIHPPNWLGVGDNLGFSEWVSVIDGWCLCQSLASS